MVRVWVRVRLRLRLRLRVRLRVGVRLRVRVRVVRFTLWCAVIRRGSPVQSVFSALKDLQG
jgi:hypothetical protein